MATTVQPTWMRANTASSSTSSRSELEELQERLKRHSMRVSRKGTASNSAAKIQVDMINSMSSEIEDLQQSFKQAEMSKRQSKMIKAKTEQEIAQLQAMQNQLSAHGTISAAAERRRNLAQSIKMTKGWTDDSPEWKQLQEQERLEQEREAKQRQADEARLKELEAQIKRKMKLREHERQKRMELRIAELKKQIDTFEQLDVENEQAEEDRFIAELEKRQREEKERREQQRRELLKQREEEDRIRREKAELLFKRKAEMQSRMDELQRAFEEKQLALEEQRLERQAKQYEQLKRRLESGEALSADEQQSVDNYTLRAQLVEMQKRQQQPVSPANNSAVDAQLQEVNRRLAEQERQLNEKLKMFEAVSAAMDRFDPEKLWKILQAAGNTQNYSFPSNVSSAAALKAQIESLQKILFDPSSTMQQIEKANIDLEKAMTEYEKTPEYRAEIAAQKAEKKQKHDAANRAALEKMRRKYSAENLKADQSLLMRVGEFPVLRIIIMEQSQIMKIYSGTWKQFSSHGLELDEMRAIRAALPSSFTPDQRVQASFAESLDEKIDQLSSSPNSAGGSNKPAPRAAAPPRPPPTVARAKNTAPANPGDLLAEIRAKARQPRANSSSVSRQAPPRPPLPGTSATVAAPAITKMPPLPPKPAAAVPKLSPGLPPPPPSSTSKPTVVSASAKPLDSAVTQAAAKSRAALETLIRCSLLTEAQSDDRALAQQTRAAVTELKQLAALRVASMPFEATRLQDLCGTLVKTLRDFVLAKRNGGAVLTEARSALGLCLDELRKLSNELATSV